MIADYSLCDSEPTTLITVPAFCLYCKDRPKTVPHSCMACGGMGWFMCPREAYTNQLTTEEIDVGIIHITFSNPRRIA